MNLGHLPNDISGLISNLALKSVEFVCPFG